MKALLFLLCLGLVFGIAACAANSEADALHPTNNAAYDLEIAKGRATSAAIETNARRAADAISTNDARTAIAANRNATLAAQAQVNAMLYAQATATAQSQFAIATSTAQYVTARAAETSQAELAQFNATQTARAAIATATSDAHRWQTTATAERRTVEAEQARVQSTATAQAIDLQIRQAQADAAEAAQWDVFWKSAVRFGLVILGLVFLVGAAIVMFQGSFALAQMFASRAARQLVIETRAGTVMLTRTARGTYVPSLVTSEGYAALPEGNTTDDAFESSQAHTVENESVDMLKITTSRGATFIARDDPQELQRETNRKLTMRLLRESIKYCTARRIDPRTTNQIPSFRDLGWSSESWVRAVAILKAAKLVTTQQGRGGGTYCADAYPTLTQLYAAIGERRASLVENQAPSPTAVEVVA